MICAFCGNVTEIDSSKLCETCRDAVAADDEAQTISVQTSANVMMSNSPLTTIMVEIGGVVEEGALREAMNAAEAAVVSSLGILKIADIPTDNNSGGN